MTRKGKYILAGIAAATVGLAAAGAIAQRGHWEGHKGRHHFGPGASAGLLGLGFGGPGLWWGLSAGLTFVAIVLTIQFHRISKRPLLRA